MSTILQMRHALTAHTTHIPISGFRLRNFEPLGDAGRWLELRQKAFSREKVGIRDWSLEDFHHELTDKPWWSPERMWVAEAKFSPLGEDNMVGAVVWADRGEGELAKPAIHWLCVHPKWRRRGVGRALIGALESAVWKAGKREVWLETHSAWTSAVRFYEAIGYEIVTPAKAQS